MWAQGCRGRTPRQDPLLLYVLQAASKAAEVSVDEEGEDIALDLIAPAGAIRMLFTRDETLDLLRVLGTIARRRLVDMNAAHYWGGDLEGDLLVQRSAAPSFSPGGLGSNVYIRDPPSSRHVP
jgi:hypothetical protein